MARRYRRSKPSIAAVIIVLLVLVVAAFVHHAAATSKVEAAPASPTAADSLSKLDALTIGAVEAAGYSRSQFGDGWKDPDHNGCDSRNDVLARDLESPTFKPGTHDCVVLTGTLHDPYSGTEIDFVRGNATSEAVQIDHIVPLSWSWSHGAASWTADQRLAFANDPRELRAVDGPTNGSKSDSGPADWMPPDTSFSCTYVELFIAVLSDYGLTVDSADSEAMRQTLSRC